MTENAGRSAQQNYDQDGKDHAVLPDGKSDGRDHSLQKSDRKAADHRTRDRADAAENRRNKGLQAQHGAHCGRGLRVCAEIQDRADSGQRRADRKGEGDGLVQTDAHQLRCTHVLRNCTHGFSETSPLYKKRQCGHREQRDHDGQDRCIAHRCSEEADTAGDDHIHALCVRAKQKLRTVFQKK